jgi:tetratricopeptide (TPR) repeat protein
MEVVSCLLFVCMVASPVVQSVPGDPSGQIPISLYQQALEVFQRGDYSEAERLLHTGLGAHPQDARALGLLGVVLDAEKKYADAEAVYNQALHLTPSSAPLLNNLGNHYLALGNLARAREQYLRAVAMEPSNPNANLRLAEMSLGAKNGGAALGYLGHLPENVKRQPATQLLRAKALYLAGQRPAAEALITQIETQEGNDPRAAFSVGMTFVEWGRYEQAEEAFGCALKLDPANLGILYNLGLAALHARHFERAREVLGIALQQKPTDVDTLYNLARAYAGEGRDDQAIVLLVQAQRLAPERPDILLLMAQTASALGYYADAATALNEYLKLKPDDDVARRERGAALIHTPKLDQGLEDLRWYVRKHPRDARGLYELGIGETVRERDKALAHFTEAIALDPKLLAARYARAILNFQESRTVESIADLQFIIQRDPKDYRALDALGKDYLTLNKTPEAIAALSQAAALAPSDPKILLHYSQALMRDGRSEESAAIAQKFKTLRPEETRARPYGGLLEFLNLPPQGQRDRYMANLRQRITLNPHDASLQARLGKLLLAEGKTAEAREAFQEVLSLTSDVKTLSDCGKTLLDEEQYDLAREFLDPVVAADPSASNTRLDLAIALFHTAGPSVALTELDKMPLAQRGGDYYLLRAEILDAMGRTEEAATELDRAFGAAPTRPDLYFQTALFQIKHGQYQRALDFLAQGLQVAPDTPEFLVTQAVTYAILEQSDKAEQLLAQVESRWPEWSLPYLFQGIILETHLKWPEGKSQLNTAIALGAQDPAAYYWVALADTSTVPPDMDDAKKAIAKGLELDENNPSIQALAGKIALSEKQYAAAIEHLTAAIRLDPDLAEAHEALGAAYRATGEKDKSIAELKEVMRIKEKNAESVQRPPAPPSITNVLFRVRPPSE